MEFWRGLPGRLGLVDEAYDSCTVELASKLRLAPQALRGCVLAEG